MCLKVRLKNNGVNRINVSLDTIIKEKYKEITRFGNLDNVLDGIEEAINNNIKIIVIIKKIEIT